uniref:EamA domain-containing protein n=1 Tax=Hanusia phi TaxID=3032 RepID=A0A7S0HS69_9CRYP|mmetsp:Transcript_31058/g.69920  ORF Transcript_31058/g.69920 Transcript_31058/m.69920 type:complete len:392 (+) Transcript_31058:110-1285(+)
MSLGVSIASRPKAVFGALTSEYLITICHQIIFLATGIFTTICNQHIFYQGGAEPSTMLLSFPTYAGMFLVVLLPISRKPAYISQRKVFFSAMFDVGSNVLCMLGLQIVGSGVFQVLYASVVCFNAILSRFFLGKRQGWTQWLGLFSIACGLAVTSQDSMMIHFDEAAERFILGITITLIGCVGYAGSYVINEFILSKGSASIVPQQLCLMVGTYGCLAHLLYFGCYTIPHWDSLVSYKVREKGGHMETILFLYFLLVVSAFLHNMSFFHLICHTGAVSTGILTALRAIGVFIVSGVWFCEHNPAQCLTTNKSIAACVVGFGAILYSIGKLSSNPSDGAMDAGLNEKGSAALETLVSVFVPSSTLSNDAMLKKYDDSFCIEQLKDKGNGDYA